MVADRTELRELELGRLAGITETENEEVIDELNSFDPDGRIEILGVREGGLVECFVPIDLIDNEDVPVDAVHATSLAA